MSDRSLQTLPTVDQAVAILDATVVTPVVAIERDLARLEEQVGANVLAVDILAEGDHPAFDKALVDGFAVRKADVGNAGDSLRLVGEVAAGAAAVGRIEPGEAMAVMTGALMPAGADAMMMVEHARIDGERVTFDRPARATGGVAAKGSDACAGQLLLRKGTLIGPAQLAVLASVGATRVSVVGDPIAHVLVTGDEIVPAGETPVGSQIRDGNGPMLASLLRHLGALPNSTSHVRDCRDAVRAAIHQTACEADVLMVTGGMSMGRHDHVPEVLRELGFDLKITKLRIKPGKPFVFATRTRPGKTDLVFGLPGNPVSSFVCTLRLASRVIARLRGLRPRDDWRWPKLATPLPANGDRELYLPAVLDADGHATPLNPNGSADVFTLARADVLIVRPIDDGPRERGEILRSLAIPR